MNDSEFLQWIHDRMIHHHGEDECYDYMWRFRSIIDKITEMEKSEKNKEEE